MGELLSFLSDFIDRFFRGVQGRLALCSLGVALALTLITSNLRLSERQYRETWGYVTAFTVLTIVLLLVRQRQVRP